MSTSTGHRRSHKRRRLVLPYITSVQWVVYAIGCECVATFQVSPVRRFPRCMMIQDSDYWEEIQHASEKIPDEYRPIPSMPSPLFVSLAQSQLELLAHSLTFLDPQDETTSSKIRSMALYLPQENSQTGQLEFLPAVLYPNPIDERVFIAGDAQSGLAPSLPKTLTKLPGFTHAASLLPGYPMVSSLGDKDTAGVGEVEEVMCDRQTRTSALSVPLFSGSQTVGVMLVWPSVLIHGGEWTEHDKAQVSRAAESLSMALSMDTERTMLQTQSERFRQSLSDSLHQVKNPLQALRTYGKLLQQQIAQTNDDSARGSRVEISGTPQLLALARHLMVQSDRVADLLLPMDSLVSESPRYLMPSPDPQHLAIAPYQPVQNVNDVDPSKKSRNPGVSAQPLELSHSEKKTGGSSKGSRTESSSENRSPRVPSVAGDLDLQMSFVPDVLEPILTPFSAIAADHNIRFEVETETDELPGVTICPKSLQEAVSNLIDNAIKYVVFPKRRGEHANLEPRVRVRLLTNPSPPAGVTIVVEDNGPGIPEEDGDVIFQRGFRSLQTSSVNGSGIGLDISRSLVHGMGGELFAEQPEQGSTFDGAVLKIVLYRTL